MTLSLFALVYAIFPASPRAEDIPARAERRAGRLVLSETLEIQMTRVLAGFWGRKKFCLLSNGKVVWTGPLVDANITVGAPGVDGEFVRTDLDGNGRLDWLALSKGGPMNAAASYDRDFDGIRAWSDDESRTALQKPWDSSYCSGLAGLVVLDDEKTVYVFGIDRAPDPFMHRNPYVQGEEHYKGMAFGTHITWRLEQSSAIPPQVWDSVRTLVEKHSCDTPDKVDKSKLPADQRIDWRATPQLSGLDWKYFIDDGLAMYQRAKDLYDETKAELPADEQLTKRELGVFDLHAFFETFPFDEIDPDNRLPAYTAMLNDFAFYQMAPEDADDARGFDERRVPVNQGVVAILAHVIRRDPNRTVAYLNLADALWRNNEDAQAAHYYKEYVARTRSSDSARKAFARAVSRSKNN